MKGTEIPLLSRIIAVVDSYDAMVNDRVYRAALSVEKEKEIRSYAVKYSRYQLDVDDQIIDVDDNFEGLAGYTKKDVWDLRLKQSDLIDESDRLDYYMHVDAQMRHGDIIYIEHDIARKDGGIVHVYCCGRRYFDSASKSIRSEIIIVDAASTHHGRVKMKRE